MPGTTFSMQTLKNSLVTLLGFDVEIWQIAVVGLLLVALVVCIVIAAIKSGKKRKVRIRKYIENEEKAILLRKQLRAVDSEIAAINFEYRHEKAAADASIVRINSDYRNEYGKADSEYCFSCDKLLKLNEKLRDISLRLKKKGIKEDESDALKKEFGKIEAEHDDLSEDVAKMREEKNERDKELKEKLDKAEAERKLKKDDYTAKLSEKERERKEITDQLDKLAATQVKISVKDAEAILAEFRASDEAEKEVRLKQAQEDVEKAKNEYLGAQELRSRYERERADAVASAKEDAKRKRTLEIAQTETEAKVGYSSPNVALADKAETEEVTDAINAAEARKTIEEFQSAANAPEDDTAATATTEDAANDTTAEIAEEVNEELKAEVGEGVKTETTEETAPEQEATETKSEDEHNAEPTDDEALAALENLENTMEGVDKSAKEEVIAEVEEEASEAEKLEIEEKAEEATAETATTEETAEEAAEETTSEKETATETTEVAAETDNKAADNTETITDEEISENAEEPLTETSIDEFENEIAEIGVTGIEDEIDEEISEEESDIPETDDGAGETVEETSETAESDEIATTEETAATEEPAIAAIDTAEEVTATTAEPEVITEPEEVVPETTETIEAAETIETVTAEPEVASEPEVKEEKIIRMPKVYYNDGIPATPIHKKSKYSKPVTRLLVKKPAVTEDQTAAAPLKEEPRKSAYLGKWKVEKTEDGKIFAKLRASNGGILLTTPVYTSEIGLKNGIASIKKCLAADNVNITANKNGKFVFKISTPSGRTIVTSDQYGAKFQCEKALDSAKRFAETAVISE